MYERQKAYRLRRIEQSARMQAALLAIREQLSGSDKPAALKILAIVAEGLGDG